MTFDWEDVGRILIVLSALAFIAIMYGVAFATWKWAVAL